MANNYDDTFSPFDMPDASGSSSVLVPEIIKPRPASLDHYGLTGANTPQLGENFERLLQERRVGRMSLFTEEKAAKIIEGIEDGKTLKEIAESIGVTRNTIWTWMQLCKPFSDHVARAREYQAHAFADSAVDLLDNADISGADHKNNMAVLRKAEQRARIRTELAKSYNFGQYGDKKQSLNVNINTEVSPVDLAKYQ